MQGLTVSVKISTMYFPAKSQDGATAVTQKASEFYRSLSASDKAALRDENAAQREPMTRAEIKKRAEKIGKKIQQLVCMHDRGFWGSQLYCWLRVLGFHCVYHQSGIWKCNFFAVVPVARLLLARRKVW